MEPDDFADIHMFESLYKYTKNIVLILWDQIIIFIDGEIKEKVFNLKLLENNIIKYLVQ